MSREREASGLFRHAGGVSRPISLIDVENGHGFRSRSTWARGPSQGRERQAGLMPRASGLTTGGLSQNRGVGATPGFARERRRPVRGAGTHLGVQRSDEPPRTGITSHPCCERCPAATTPDAGAASARMPGRGCVDITARVASPQTVALRLICECEEEIRKFAPQEYWTIEAAARGSALASTRCREERIRAAKAGRRCCDEPGASPPAAASNRSAAAPAGVAEGWRRLGEMGAWQADDDYQPGGPAS
jgi:hypothetical protein